MRVLVKSAASLDPGRVKVDPRFYREIAGTQYWVFEVDKGLISMEDVFWTGDRGDASIPGSVVYGIPPEDVDTLWVEGADPVPPWSVMDKIPNVFVDGRPWKRYTPPSCDCGGAKAKTTHAHWCSTRSGERP